MERQPGDALLLKQAREPNALQTVEWEAMIYRAFQLCLLRIRYAATQSLFSNMTMTKACSSFALSRTRARWRRNRIKAGFPSGRRRRSDVRWALLHSLELDSSPMSALSEGLPRRLAHALFLHRPDHALYRKASYGNLQAVRILQSFPAFGALIDALIKSGDRAVSFIST